MATLWSPPSAGLPLLLAGGSYIRRLTIALRRKEESCSPALLVRPDDIDDIPETAPPSSIRKKWSNVSPWAACSACIAVSCSLTRTASAACAAEDVLSRPSNPIALGMSRPTTAVWRAMAAPPDSTTVTMGIPTRTASSAY